MRTCVHFAARLDWERGWMKRRRKGEGGRGIESVGRGMWKVFERASESCGASLQLGNGHAERTRRTRDTAAMTGRSGR